MMGNQVRPTNPFTEFKQEDIEQSIPSRFEQISAKYSKRIAIQTEDRDWTYAQLNQEANRIARCILMERGEGNEPIALLMANSSMIMAFLGVLKTGKFYVPIDPSYPMHISLSMLKDSRAKLLLSDNKNYSRAQDLAPQDCRVINLDSQDVKFSTENLSLSQTPDSIAYIVYTSGSTGQPKGVIQNHRNVLHCIMRYTNAMHIRDEDRLTLLHSCSFSAARIDIYSALLNGATILPFDINEKGYGEFSDWLCRNDVTIYHYIPTAFRNFMISFSGEADFPNLRLIILGSEPLYRQDVELYKRHFSSDCILVNRMGTSEAGNTHFNFINTETPIQGNTVPVGYPVKDNETLLVNDANKEVNMGEAGEILIKSLYLSPGYWKNPELTKASFFADSNGGEKRIYRTGDVGQITSDGVLVHLGRKDFQVKIKGYRVDITGVENSLLELNAIEKAVVHTRKDRSGDRRLVAYIVPTPESQPTVNELRRALSIKLADYMIPSTFVIMDSLPLTPTGKVNRLALPDPGTKRPELDTLFMPPRSTVEEELEEIWSEVLEVDRVGIQDHFLDLGGDSVRATQLISRVLGKFEVEVSMRTLLLEASTISEMAELIHKHKAN